MKQVSYLQPISQAGRIGKGGINVTRQRISEVGVVVVVDKQRWKGRKVASTYPRYHRQFQGTRASHDNCSPTWKLEIQATRSIVYKRTRIRDPRRDLACTGFWVLGNAILQTLPESSSNCIIYIT